MDERKSRSISRGDSDQVASADRLRQYKALGERQPTPIVHDEQPFERASALGAMAGMLERFHRVGVAKRKFGR